jgi:heme exporter protein C
MASNRSGISVVLSVLTPLALVGALLMAFLYAPTERTMGHVQRIFYFHVPSAWLAFLAFLLVFIFSIAYLARGSRKWDIYASCSAEVGIVFCSLVLITGPLWARPVWGIWWTWDLRLTLTLVLWLIYVGYLMLRRYVVEPEKRARFSAVLGIIGFLDVPLVYVAIRWWRTQHPSPVMGGGEGSGLAASMWTTLLVCLGAFMLLFFTLLRKRVRLERLRDELDGLRQKEL